MKKTILILFCLLLSKIAFTQIDSTKNYKKKINTIAAVTAISYGSSYAALSYFWYANQPLSSFHFFNDNDEWMQVDKLGHSLVSFAISETAVETLSKAGMKRKKAILIGSLTGLVLQTPVEILDGFVSSYGASFGDEIANFSGSALVFSQYILWDDIRIHPKFFYHNTDFPNNTPKKGILGSAWYDKWLKDYNGQAYWLSFDIHKFLGNETKFPKWLNLAIGTGASNMFRAEYNDNVNLGYTPYRRYFLSLDLNLTAIKTESRFLRSCLKTLNYIRIPLPTLEYNSEQGFKGHWLY